MLSFSARVISAVAAGYLNEMWNCVESVVIIAVNFECIKMFQKSFIIILVKSLFGNHRHLHQQVTCDVRIGLDFRQTVAAPVSIE